MARYNQAAVSMGSSTAEAVLFEEGYCPAFFLQKVCGRGPDDPTADDDNASCLIHRSFTCSVFEDGHP